MTTQPEIENVSTLEAPIEEQGRPSLLSAALANMTIALDKLEKSDEKIQLSLDFMRAALSESRAPRFKDFWEAKRICLPFFKESLGPAVRSRLWAEYIEISAEARKLKEILDEESAFAVEQIDLAIAGLEKDLDQYDALLEQTPIVPLVICRTIKKKIESYHHLQRELNLLNTFAARVNGLRKEVIKTEMRIRFKNRFFDRLSAAGDKVFPKRKELIRSISSEFLSDVKELVKKDFPKEIDPNFPIFELREEIKDLQTLAKQLTLDTHAFTETRLELSKCWDFLKQAEKERRSDLLMKKQEFKKNFDLVMEKVNLLAERCQAEGCTLEDAGKLSGEVLSFMRNIELGREEVKSLKDAIQKAKSPVYEKLKKEQEQREHQLEEIQRQKREKLDGLRNEIQTLISSIETLSMEEITTSRTTFIKQVKGLNATPAEQEIFDELLKSLRDKMIEKKEQAMMHLSQDERNSLEQLKNMLDERKLQRQEIRAQVELYRKALSGSGFDFEKAIRYHELIDAEKVRLEKTAAAIEEIEQKIADFEE